MEIPVVAPQDGTVASIEVAAGDAVENGSTSGNTELIKLEVANMSYVADTLSNLTPSDGIF